MDRLKRIALIFAILCNAQNARPWLSDYFDTKDEHSLFRVEAVLKLMQCNDTINCRVWEESVRMRCMSTQKCEEAKELEKCVYKRYQDPVSEYVRRLVEDAQKLCKIDTTDSEVHEKLKVALLVLAICVGVVLVIINRFSAMRGRGGKGLDHIDGSVLDLECSGC